MRGDGLIEWINCFFPSSGWERRRQPLTELAAEWGSHQEKKDEILDILTQANQSLSNLKSTTERGRPSLSMVYQIRQNMAVRQDAPDPVNSNGFWWDGGWADTEDSDGLTKTKRLCETEKALALKHILQEHYLSNPEEIRTNTGTDRQVRGRLTGWVTDRKNDRCTHYQNSGETGRQRADRWC